MPHWARTLDLCINRPPNTINRRINHHTTAAPKTLGPIRVLLATGWSPEGFLPADVGPLPKQELVPVEVPPRGAGSRGRGGEVPPVVVPPQGVVVHSAAQAPAGLVGGGERGSSAGRFRGTVWKFLVRKIYFASKFDFLIYTLTKFQPETERLILLVWRLLTPFLWAFI